MTFAHDKNQQILEINAEQDYEQHANKHTARVSRFKFEPDQVMSKLHHSIVGQEQALEEIEKMLKVVKADFNCPNRPLSVTLMLGPTGVGKTETVRLISEVIFGRSDAFCRIDMNTLAQEHYSAALTGAPPGYVGSKEGHSLFDLEAIKGSFSKPGIVLFDEIEKASNEVIRSLLNILDTGMLKMTGGTKSIDFRNCMIFMTSNIGAKKSQERLKQLAKYPNIIKNIAKKIKLDDHAITTQALQHKFDPEFINRIERILSYQPVEEAFIPRLVQLELDKLNHRLSKQGRMVKLTESAHDYLSHHYDICYGARGLSRNFRTLVEPMLAEEFFKSPETSHFLIDLDQQKLKIKYC